MSVSSTEIIFVQVVDDCIVGKITKKQALELLKSRYESVYKNIKKELGEDHISFCCYVPCEFEDWIEICDRAERNKPLSDRLENGKIIQNVIDKVTTNYREVLELENWESKADNEVWQEVHQIQNLCRENREIAEYYEKCVDKIMALQADDVSLPQLVSEEAKSPEWIKNQIQKTLDILCIDKYIETFTRKDGSIEYRINETTTKIQETLKAKKMINQILLPEINDIDDFIINHLRSGVGNSLKDAMRTKKNREHKRTKSN
jgi:hypothetical protein